MVRVLLCFMFLLLLLLFLLLLLLTLLLLVLLLILLVLVLHFFARRRWRLEGAWRRGMRISKEQG